MGSTRTQDSEMTDRRSLEAGTQPPLLYPPYRSTVKRAPAQPLIRIPERYSALAVPLYGYSAYWRDRQRSHAPACRRTSG